MERQSWITLIILYMVYVVFATLNINYFASNVFTGIMSLIGIIYSFNKVLKFLIWNYECEQPDVEQHLDWVDQYLENIYHN